MRSITWKYKMTYPVPDGEPVPEGWPGTTGAVTKVGAALEDPAATLEDPTAALEYPAAAPEDTDGAAPAPAPTVTVERMVVGIQVLIVMTETDGAAEVAGRAALFDDTDTAAEEAFDGVADGTTEGAADVVLYDAADVAGTAAIEVDTDATAEDEAAGEEAAGDEEATAAEVLDGTTEVTVYVVGAAADELATLLLTTG